MFKGCVRIHSLDRQIKYFFLLYYSTTKIGVKPLIMASSSTNRRRQNRRTRNSNSVVNVDDDVAETSSATCIDLTSDTSSSYDVIDLTRGNSITLMDSPVVVLTPTDNVGPVRRRRGSGRRGRHRSNSSQQLNYSTSENADIQLPSSYVLLSEDSDSDDFPEVPFEVPQSSMAANESLLRSPEGVKIACPVCLDDTKQIQRNGKQVISTTCGHIFCNVCIKAAINNQHACPTCRKKLYLRNIHPLFL